MKYKAVVPFILVMLTVFMAVASSFVCHGIFVAKEDADAVKATVYDFTRRNIFVSIRDSVTNTLDTNLIISFDPKDKSVDMISIPSDTKVRIASSDQAFKDVMNIGGLEMVHDALRTIVPLPVDYHLIIKSNDLYSEDGDYNEVLKYVFTKHLWEQEELVSYLDQILGLATTDLTLIKTGEYAEFINEFAEHTGEYYTIPGQSSVIGDKAFYVADTVAVNELINNKILNQKP